ncbi:hypothetical protein [Streptomyces sp. NPDC059455]|uniref:hypothetical protein n=1 Tax=Streptomyces sp. NPDC059455 TaxID=3346837 RepID=UPI00368B0F43
MIEDILRAARINVPAHTLEQRMEADRLLAENIKKVTARLAQAERRGAKRWLAPSSPELSVLLQDLTNAVETPVIVSLRPARRRPSAGSTGRSLPSRPLRVFNCSSWSVERFRAAATVPAVTPAAEAIKRSDH